MSIDRAEAFRLAQVCLPKILGPLIVDGGAMSSVSESDVEIKSLCRLWAGMGYIYSVTVRLSAKRTRSFVVKRVVPPPKRKRSPGDERKAASYLVEARFYERVAPSLIKEHRLRMPIPYHVERGENDGVSICMSRLKGASGDVGRDRARAALDWLATLHAATWGSKADEYVAQKAAQPIGSYWYLDTRPSEHDAMPRGGWEGRLRLAARAIDERLRRDRMQCCIHGDAKDANMLFVKGGVSMYDFQYFGKAPPSVDLAYFLCVAVGDTDPEYTKYYHQKLLGSLNEGNHQPTLKELDESVALALCDFQRFMSGWGQWGSDISSVVIEVLNRLDGGRILESEDAYKEAMRREYG